MKKISILIIFLFIMTSCWEKKNELPIITNSNKEIHSLSWVNISKWEQIVDNTNWSINNKDISSMSKKYKIAKQKNNIDLQEEIMKEVKQIEDEKIKLLDEAVKAWDSETAKKIRRELNELSVFNK